MHIFPLNPPKMFKIIIFTNLFIKTYFKKRSVAKLSTKLNHKSKSEIEILIKRWKAPCWRTYFLLFLQFVSCSPAVSPLESGWSFLMKSAVSTVTFDWFHSGLSMKANHCTTLRSQKDGINIYSG